MIKATHDPTLAFGDIVRFRLKDRYCTGRVVRITQKRITVSYRDELGRSGLKVKRFRRSPKGGS
ncbi:MAG: hypothetical protein V3V32_04560 [Dehalococcoidia bacterium]